MRTQHVLLLFASTLLPGAVFSQEQTQAPHTLHKHVEYLELNGPNSKYYKSEGSYTKWIGVNTELLTDIPVTKTVAGSVTTQTTSAAIMITTATKAADGVEVGDVNVVLTPKLVNILNKIGEDARAACGITRRRAKRAEGACRFGEAAEFGTRADIASEAGGVLADPSLGIAETTFPTNYVDPAIVAIIRAVSTIRGTQVAAGVQTFILLYLLGMETKRIAPAAFISHVRLQEPDQGDDDDDDDNCPDDVADRPICVHEDCKGPNDKPQGEKATCSTGEHKGCECLKQGISSYQEVSGLIFDGKTWWEIQQQFLKDLSEYKPKDTPDWCLLASQPGGNVVPDSYCQCGEGGKSTYSVAEPTATPYVPCPYTKPPGPTITVKNLATPYPKCNEQWDTVVPHVTGKESDKAYEQFCKDNNGKELSENADIEPCYVDHSQDVKGVNTEFVLRAKSAQGCGKKKIVEKDCKNAFFYITGTCWGNKDRTQIIGGIATQNCQQYEILPLPFIPGTTESCPT